MREYTVLKIGEFARVAQVSIATLRHYDQYGLLKPTTLDPETGYRYYALDQLPRLNRILALKDLGFPLEQIAQFLENNLSLEQLQGMLTLKQAQTQLMIDTEQARLSRIAARLHHIEQEGKMPIHEVLLKEVATLHVASIRAIIPLQRSNHLSTKIIVYLSQQQIQHTQPSMLLLHSRSEQREDGLYIDAEAAIPLPIALPGNSQINSRTLPGGLMASTIHTGDDLFTGRAYAALHLWMKENTYKFVGPPRLLYLQRDEHMHPDQYVTEIQFPVAKQYV
jgi:DNA-binding transcriptional MerR regulator